MPTEPHSFRRLVLSLQPRAPDDTMRLAVDLAELLHLDLLGLFLEDASLRDLARIPFAREIRLLGGGWHPIEIESLSRDIDFAARSIERMFAGAAKRLATKCQFEIARGPLFETITSISQADDIVMIVEPLSPAERATHQFAWLMQAAFRSAAAVLLVPQRIIRAKGPVVAIATAGDDPSIHAAAAIAIAAKEPMTVVDIGEVAIDDARIRALADGLAVKITHVFAGKSLQSHPSAFSPRFFPSQERLIVMTRGVFADAETLAIASVRRIPVLVLEPTRPRDKPASS